MKSTQEPPATRAWDSAVGPSCAWPHRVVGLLENDKVIISYYITDADDDDHDDDDDDDDDRS